jgi:hypothetical protein
MGRPSNEQAEERQPHPTDIQIDCQFRALADRIEDSVVNCKAYMTAGGEMAGEQFDKDFGYLMPFIDRVAEAAESISDPAARNELASLVRDERARWIRIRDLLSGAAGKRAANQSAAPPADEPQKEPLRFTVGSLRKREQ